MATIKECNKVIDKEIAKEFRSEAKEKKTTFTILTKEQVEAGRSKAYKYLL